MLVLWGLAIMSIAVVGLVEFVHFYLEEIGIPSVLLPALNFMRIDKNDEPDLNFIEQNLNTELKKYPKEKLFITQGYICRNTFGEIDNLKRGGSDYTATLIGAALRMEEIQIWTDVDGMMTSDPRLVPEAEVISEVGFQEAAVFLKQLQRAAG